ncbi:HPr family phosphocarrier protein [Caproiciproducens sp. NJN-50]|nr:MULTISPECIES: HPr family phosphocarrier protein [Acutalibacteraceae]QAT51219.1 HPr family phosphocarrier protein [Caproiciproducens sp. NJN-50]
MKEFEYVIKNESGIHARPAGLLVKQAQRFQSQVTVMRGSKNADAKKLFPLMGLCIKGGDKVKVKANGPDETEAIQVLEDFFKNNL